MQRGGESAPATWIEIFRDLLVPVQSGETNMTSKINIAALAALITIVAAPAFAGDQDTATELRDSGRYIPQVTVPAGAYASARKGGHQAPAQSQTQSDFQLVGHN
jgi:hypothetical protein